MKKVIVIRLENVLVKKFDVEKSFQMLVERMKEKEKDVDDLIRKYKDDMGLDWEKGVKKELKERYETDFERKEIYVEGKRVLNDLLGLKKKNECLNDMRIVVVSEMGGRRVKGLLMNNELDEESLEVRRVKEGEIGDCLKEMGIGNANYEKVLVLSNSNKDIEDCLRLGVKYTMCGWGKVEGMESKDIYGVIGLRKV